MIITDKIGLIIEKLGLILERIGLTFQERSKELHFYSLLRECLMEQDDVHVPAAVLGALLSAGERLIAAIEKLCDELGCEEEEAVEASAEEEEDVPMVPDLPEEKEDPGSRTGRSRPHPSAWFLQVPEARSSPSQVFSKWTSPTLPSLRH